MATKKAVRKKVSKERIEEARLDDIVVRLKRGELKLRLVCLNRATDDDDIKTWLKEHPEVRPLDLDDELRPIWDEKPKELGAFVFKSDIVMFGCRVDDGSEARLSATPIIYKNGKMDKMANWTRGPVFRWDPDTRFMFVIKEAV